jgi:DNA uptake protein ComE-like DNA-binding protein
MKTLAILLASLALAIGLMATPQAAPVTAKTGELLDINSAALIELDKLPGIGPAYAEKIIRNRPYRTKEELADRKIIPRPVYEKIRDMVVARQPK